MKQVQYILGVDGGGSKTLARLEHLPSGQQWEARGDASSLSLGVESAVAQILQLARQLAGQAGCDMQQMWALAGLAGAGNRHFRYQALELLERAFGKADIVSDAKTSAYGANLGQPAAVVALGTGSVAMVLDNTGRETMVGGWGLLVGDEGSGARLGVNAVSQLLWELDLQQSPSQLGLYLMSVLGTQRAEILAWLAAANPTRFAALVPQILALKDCCPLAGRLYAGHLQEVRKLIMACRQYGPDIPLIVIGGLAQPTLTDLANETELNLMAARGSALDGACLLARQLAKDFLNDEEAK